MPLKLGAAAWRRWEGGPHASTATLFLLPDFPTFPTERKRASRHRFKSAVSAGASGAGEGGERRSACARIRPKPAHRRARLGTVAQLLSHHHHHISGWLQSSLRTGAGDNLSS